MMDKKIKIVSYDPTWPKKFNAEEEKIRAALGAVACHVEHVGSTSVPGLDAKPVIDIHLTVPESRDEATYLPQLEAIGYRLIHREPDWFEHRMLKGDEPEVNLHIFSLGCTELDRCRLFRDWLRADRADRDLYARTKHALAARNWASVQDYADAKSDIVAMIMARAIAGQQRSS